MDILNYENLNEGFYIDSENKRGIWHLTLSLLPNIQARFVLQPHMRIKNISDVLEKAKTKALENKKKIIFLKENSHKNFSMKKTYTIHDIGSLFSKIIEFIDMGFERTERSLENKREQKLYEEMISSKPYHQFMYASHKKRKVTCYIAPTNAGKTYHAREKLISEVHPDFGLSVVLLPLRALAIENFLELEKKGIPTSLITGEERNIHHMADIICQTVETFDYNKIYNTILVDEAQLTFTPDRGSSYLETLISARCNHLIMTASQESRKRIEKLFSLLNEEVEFVELERLCPLTPLKSPVTIEELKKGDLIVAFSARKIHHLAKTISDQGFKVGTLYGAMSPSARRHMMKHYNEGNIDIMVSTDAIGMGVSFPIDRVLFTESKKFDGEEVRELTVQEMKQIAGRAGRFGLKTKGEYGTLVGFFDNDDIHDSIIEAVESTPDDADLTDLYALPNKHAFKVSPISISRTLHAWIKATCESSSLYSNSKRMLHDFRRKTDILEQEIKKGSIDKETAINLLFIAFSLEKHEEFFMNIIQSISKGTFVKIQIPESNDLEDYEFCSEQLAIAAQLQRVFPDISESEDVIAKKQSIVGKKIYRRLIELYAK